MWLQWRQIALAGVWKPGQVERSVHNPEELRGRVLQENQEQSVTCPEDVIPQVWIPKSAGSSPIVERKEFRPVNFESPILTRRNVSQVTNVSDENLYMQSDFCRCVNISPFAIPETKNQIIDVTIYRTKDATVFQI